MSEPRPSKRIQSALGPLTPDELVVATGLLHRAVKFGQSYQLYGYYKNALIDHQFKGPGKKLIQEMQKDFDEIKEKEKSSGSMTDASKRRLEEEVAESDSSDWEGLSTISQTSMPMGKSGVPTKYGYVNREIKLPVNTSFDEWSRTVCQMNKVKHLELSYAELVVEAETSTLVHGYLKWLRSAYGVNSSKYNPKAAITPAVDLALYLEAVGWVPEAKEPSECSFTRVVKKG